MGLEVAVGRPVSDAVEPVYKVSREVVLIEEVLETDPEVISTASEKEQLKGLSNSIKEKGKNKLLQHSLLRSSLCMPPKLLFLARLSQSKIVLGLS